MQWEWVKNPPEVYALSARTSLQQV
jgi:hypothetical protein